MFRFIFAVNRTAQEGAMMARLARVWVDIAKGLGAEFDLINSL